ncbi:MAG: DNA topoisomerase VI, partial [Euryarchaeota archaeon]|nr:DNA topoisomerase VI [Euryarchaeota archaeon]
MVATDKKVPEHRKEHDSLARDRLLGLAENLYDQFVDEIVPNVNLPSRTKNNIEYSEKSDVWVYGDRT